MSMSVKFVPKEDDFECYEGREKHQAFDNLDDEVFDTMTEFFSRGKLK